MSTVDSALSFMVAFKSGLIIAFPVRENVHWTHLLGLRFRLFRPFRNVLESIVNNGKTLGILFAWVDVCLGDGLWEEVG